MKMDVIDKSSPELNVPEVLKSSSLENENKGTAVAADLCQNTNGVDEIGKAGQSEVIEVGTDHIANPAPETAISEDMTIPSETIPKATETNEHDTSVTTDITADENDVTSKESIAGSPLKNQDASIVDVAEVVTEVVIEDVKEKPDCPGDTMDDNMTETLTDNIPKFKTEVVIEASDCTLSDADGYETTNNILSGLGESIELSEVLHYDDSEKAEKNNGTVRQEVFNKEELLDILQGNDVETIPSVAVTEVKHVFKSPSKEIETKLALQQLSRLKNEKKKIRGTVRITKSKKDKNYGENKGPINNIGATTDTKFKIKSNQALSKQSEENVKVISNDVENNTEKDTSKDQSKNIVNVLVMDWDDDEQEANESDQSTKSQQNVIEKNEMEIVETNQGETNHDKGPGRSSEETVLSEEQSLKEKLGDENQPQRRLGRVIKKKVIFDPDNPDTFTKAKSKEPVKDHNIKEDPLLKKVKQEQTPSRSKSKSPMSNLQWKKPSSKNNKQNRRLTEVDKLLMDEGAVNMIYQLTPEAPKGKKSRETKAEFIKKIQSSTPDSKEMKFRERKILKYEDGEAKKILGGKHRVSLNSSIKSPSVSEDFETHSADDSIIYRRHSSSSYSSSCMSPRRLSDVDSSSAQSNTRTSQKPSDNQSHDTESVSTSDQACDVFMANAPETLSKEIINKDDYLSIKEKLNSKLSLALNKRKRESSKNEKPSKQKKVSRNDDESDKKSSLGELKHVTIKIDQRLAEITIEKTGFQHNVQVLKEIEQALVFVNSIKETSVTLLTECCTLCSNLDLKHLVEDDKIQRVNSAIEVAETISSLLLTLDKHSKLVCCGVGAECRGVGLGVAALSDIVLASERATFTLAGPRAPPQPAAAALTARCRLPHPIVDDLILFGRQLSASEALRGGLVSRVLWPDRFTEQVYSIAKDIASEPASNLMLKKNLLNLKKIGEGEHTLPSCLDAERDIFVQYWTSVEGQELLRANTL